ncbi:MULTISPECIES: asparagine synthase-related protein [unclassified Micromonospora]|uniref:asparagine synthase-related protein n=1 Tax=unclassified Micromonospora TaxID=2617518 RepID=UPI0036340312
MRWPTAYELATGLVQGMDPDAVHLPPPTPDPATTPLAALEASVLPALRRPPCVLSFSGGLDSSLVLAVTARVARREGLPDPVPVTWRFRGAPRAEESSWQDEVIGALGLRGTWQVLTADDDLDLVGPVAGRFLHRYGLRHPLNLHLHLPIVELAAGGSLLTGVGGDQMLAGWRRPDPASVPAYLREAVGRARARLLGGQRSGTEVFPWLRPEAAQEILGTHRAEQRAEPDRLADRIAWHLRRRDLRMTMASFGLVAGDHDVTVGHPLLDARFVAALVGWAGRRRRPPRAELLAGIAAGELPAVVVAPRAKAHFLEVFLRAPTREFVRGWDGGGVDTDVVDPGRLRAVWARWPVPECTSGLVQHLWLRQHPPAPTVRPARSGGAEVLS